MTLDVFGLQERQKRLNVLFGGVTYEDARDFHWCYRYQSWRALDLRNAQTTSSLIKPLWPERFGASIRFVIGSANVTKSEAGQAVSYALKNWAALKGRSRGRRKSRRMPICGRSRRRTGEFRHDPQRHYSEFSEPCICTYSRSAHYHFHRHAAGPGDTRAQQRNYLSSPRRGLSGSERNCADRNLQFLLPIGRRQQRSLYHKELR